MFKSSEWKIKYPAKLTFCGFQFETSVIVLNFQEDES